MCVVTKKFTNMKCDCIQKVNEKLKENLGTDAQLATAMSIDRKSHKVESVITVMAHYHKRKKDGTLQQKESVAWIRAEYCPFCGVKLEGEKSATTSYMCGLKTNANSAQSPITLLGIALTTGYSSQ